MRPFWVMFAIGAVLGAALVFVLVRTGKLGPASADGDDDESYFDAVVQVEPGSPQQQRVDYAKKLAQSLRGEYRDVRVRADGLVLEVRTAKCDQAFVAKLVEKPSEKTAISALGFARVSCSAGRKARAWVDL